MVRVAQFSGPEPDKKGIFGQAGDQLQGPAYETGDIFGGEVDIIPYSPDWEIIYRPTDQAAADRIAWTMERAARNKMVGYSQGSARLTFWRELQAVGGDPQDITSPVNSDCSAGLAAAINNAGISVNPNMTTRTEDKELMRTGEFLKITARSIIDDQEILLRGDILWRSGHTAVVIDDGAEAWAGPFLQTTGKAYRRTGPAVTFFAFGALAAGVRLQALPGAENGWRMLFTTDGEIGWTSGKLLTEDLGKHQIKVTGLAVWIRSEPDKRSDTLKLAHRGQIFPATGEQRKDDRGQIWHRIIFGEYGIAGGWISGKYSEEVWE